MSLCTIKSRANLFPSTALPTRRFFMEEPRIVLEKKLYTATATATGGRDGEVRSDDGTLTLTVTPPRELGGSGAGTNPEQLFAAGYAACFGSALTLVARRQKITTGPVAITARVTLGPTGAAFGLAVELSAHIPELA